MFSPVNISYYNISSCGKRITKSADGWQQSVYMNKFVYETPTFSVKVIRDPSHWLFVGIALDAPASHLTGAMWKTGYCIKTAFGEHYGENATVWYYTMNANILEGQTVTVQVDVAAKTIAYKVNGNSTGNTKFLNLTDSQMLQLRPVVSIYYLGDIVQIVP